MRDILLLFLLLSASFLLTLLIRRLALRYHWFDLPNERSSHHVPTPRSGGLSFVLLGSAAVFYCYRLGFLQAREVMALMLALPVAALGLWDDFRNLNARTRVAVQLAAALGVMLAMGGLPRLPVGSLSVDLAWIGYAIGALGLVWLVNLYNFMDGIDGIAALEGIFAGLAAAFFSWRAGQGGDALLPSCLAAVLAGFLLLNLPRAKIFMGDVGSQYLGLTLGTLGLVTISHGGMHVWSWAILLGVFIVDSTLTLARRVTRGQLWYSAHRSHAYQHAALWHGSHGKVGLCITAINLGWLFPMAWISLLLVEWAILVTIVAYTPLIFLGFAYRAGTEDQPRRMPGRSKNNQGAVSLMKGFSE